MRIFRFEAFIPHVLSKQSKVKLENDVAAFDFMQFNPLLDWSARIFTVLHYIGHSDLSATKELY